MTDAEEVRYFRGTTIGFPGSRALQEIGITSVSTVPVVAAIFATESSNYGIGVLHIASSRDLAGVQIVAGNVLADIECEVGITLQPAEFARRASCTIWVEQARRILLELGITLPARIRGPAGVDVALRTLPRLTDEQIRRFVDAALSIAGG